MKSDLHNQVRVWQEFITIPTYKIGEPDKNPMFLEKRVYQGSSGVVYPYPVIDRVFDEKRDKQYTAIFLENRYLKIMLLPEIGGRVQMALDKTNDYHFVYYNRVIKPALVGLAGPWISGGIEFNWPQHHRPSTFEPVDYIIETDSDGNQTVWLSEIEKMYGMKGMVEFTLYPNIAYLELKVQLYNRTSVPQTFLWWANPAVRVNDNYQSIFPPDVRAVMDHGKRDVSTFPIATGTYYKMDYAPGTDISRYKNIPVPTSFMAYHSDFDFLGCYDHGKDAGMMHVANHHIVPGKKQWTWGNGEFGQAWDRQLTDEDGPYIELMCGAYTDNQPDFSWLQPGEEKSFTQVFMPYKLIGGAKNANKDVVINLEFSDKTAYMGVYVTRPRTVRIQLLDETDILFEQVVDLNPETAFTEETNLPRGVIPQGITLRVLDDDYQLISFTPLSDETHSVPQPATAARKASEIDSIEELFLNGQHLEQYRHATYESELYYEEALYREPTDSRCNNAMGLLLFRRGKFADAEVYFRRAIASLTRRNSNPYNGEPFYNLGMSLKMQGCYKDAFDTFYKSVWNSAWQDSGYFELARLACRDGRFDEAYELVERSLARNKYHHQARHLKIAMQRQLGRTTEALEGITLSLKLDPANFGVLYERHLLTGDGAYQQLMCGVAHNFIEISLDYAHAGLFSEAISLLNEAPQNDPMVKYYLGWYHQQDGDLLSANKEFQDAAVQPTDYCFPNKLECVLALENATELNPKDSNAFYYLGLFWYSRRRYQEAINCWRQSRNLNSHHPTVHRNLGLAYVNKLSDLEKALESYQGAFELKHDDARIFFKLDQLYKKLNASPLERLERIESYLELVNQRDDLTIERISLLNLLGRHQEALDLLANRNFHPWEGGEGKVTAQYIISLVELSKQKMKSGNFYGAIEDLERARIYPPNLGEGKLHGIYENNIFYYLGYAYKELNNSEQAHNCFLKASAGLIEPTSQTYYNDQPPDLIFFQAKAHTQLGQHDIARSIFLKLIDYGSTHLEDQVSIDYFAVSLPDFLVFDLDLDKRNQTHCHYMMGLGYLGLGQIDKAKDSFNTVLSLDIYHIGAVTHLASCTQTDAISTNDRLN